MMPMGGTTANLPLDEALKKAVEEAPEKNTRIVKVSVDGKPPKLTVKEAVVPAGEKNFTEDFEAMLAGPILEEAVPCILLVRLLDKEGTVPGAGGLDWLLISWMPDGAPVRQRMMYTASVKTIKDAFEDLRFKEMKGTEKADISIKDVMEKARGLSRGMTRDERHSAMTQQEIDQEEVREELDKVQKAAPKKMAGMVALAIKTQESFEKAMEGLLAEEGKTKAILARLTGPKREELAGELMEDAGLPSQLKGRLPTDEACYLILRPADARLLIMSWLPDGCPPRTRMSVSTFKKSVVQLLEEKAPGSSITKAEITDEDDMKDDLCAEQAKGEEPKEEGEKEASPAKKPGFKPPVGGFALPGLMGPPRG